MGGITDIIAWREASKLVEAVRDLCAELRGPGALKAADQLMSAAESIASNVAEGYGRGVSKDGIRFFRFAKASGDEVESRLYTSARAKRVTMRRISPLIDHVRRVQFLVRRYSESIERRLAEDEVA